MNDIVYLDMPALMKPSTKLGLLRQLHMVVADVWEFVFAASLGLYEEMVHVWLAILETCQYVALTVA